MSKKLQVILLILSLTLLIGVCFFINAIVNQDQAGEEATLDSIEPEVIESQEKLTHRLQVINYHHLANEGDGTLVITKERFKEHMQALKEAGYNTVSTSEIIAYVETEATLPEQAILITFDDGYLSNYELAYPVLKELSMKATFFAIGVSVGKTQYKNTENPIIPHYNYEQAKEMIDSGLIEVQTHTYDLHQYGPYESDEDNVRPDVNPLPSDSEEDYFRVLRNDFQMAISALESNLENEVNVLAYPKGEYTDISELVAEEVGLVMTLTTKPADTTLIKGGSQSMRLMNRYTASHEMSGEDLVHLLEEGTTVNQIR